MLNALFSTTRARFKHRCVRVAGCAALLVVVGCERPRERYIESYYTHRTAADQCLNVKLDKLNNIDGETPSAGAMEALTYFCVGEYGSGKTQPDGGAPK